MMKKSNFVILTILLIFISFSSFYAHGQEVTPEKEFQKLLAGENKENFLANEKKGNNFNFNFGDKSKLQSHDRDILIKPNTEVILERSESAEFSTILIEGTLRILDTGEFPLRVQKIIVAPSGKLIIGTQSSPIENIVEVNFVKNQKGEIGFFVFGEMLVQGKNVGTTFAELSRDYLPGEQIISTTKSAKKWSPGNKIVITSPGTDPNHPTCMEENEIVGVDGIFVNLKKPLNCFHRGSSSNSNEIKSHVALLSRNIVIKSEDPNNRGSVNFFHGSSGYLKFAEFRDLGPKKNYPSNFVLTQLSSNDLDKNNKNDDFNFFATIEPMTIMDNLKEITTLPDEDVPSLSIESKVQLFIDRIQDWHEDKISDAVLITELKKFIEFGVIKIQVSDISELDEYDLSIPQWFKNIIDFWQNEQISDEDLFRAIEYILNLQIEKQSSIYGS